MTAKKYTVECRECGTSFVAERAGRVFCSTACLTTWRNRRATRGAMLYDFMMTQRYDRMNEHDARRMVQNLCRAFRDSDKASRSGRRSWRDYKDALQDVPLAFGQSGDNR